MSRPGRTFGLTSNGGPSRGRGTFRRRGGHTGKSGPPRGGDPEASRKAAAAASLTAGAYDDATTAEDRFAEAAARDELDEKLGFERVEAGPSRQAWLVNMHPTLVRDPGSDGSPGYAGGKSAVDFYFIEDDSSSFKVTLPYAPYFLVACKPNTDALVEEWLLRRFEGLVLSVSHLRKEDLRLPNHLVAGNSRALLKVSFHNVQDLLAVRRELLPLAERAQKRRDAVDAYADVLADGAAAQLELEMEDAEQVYAEVQDGWSGAGGGRRGAGPGGRGAVRSTKAADPEECIVDLREYDVPYYLRVSIDKEIRVGLWYDVSFHEGRAAMSLVPERVKRAEPTVMAFDIETTKQPLKFPDAETDCVMMISYMIDGQGFLITNRQIVSDDIEDFEYSPKEEYEGPFIIFNEPDELSVLERFFSHVREARPRVMATYNGDSFDFPFLDARATFHGLSMLNEIGFSKDREGEYKSTSCSHLDCFRWVKRDSYLPQGSQGLKAVTVAKLGYDPMELDPELMTPYAIEQPQTLAQYSVSDAVATYYLYMKYVHPFIFSLCNIIPLNPDEVLRKGSGTLCETLLMVQAYRGNIAMPNRHTDPVGRTYEGHLLESETYVGGHVEALEAGVFRSDIPTDFKLDPAALQQLIDQLDAALRFSITVEGKLDLNDVTNYHEVKAEIQGMLERMRDEPLQRVGPLIYHLDVAAMYPNIMLSNRLQPDSVVSDAMCATCDYNRPGMRCDKKMEWAWRGEYFPAKRDEVNMIRSALASETFPPKRSGGPKRAFHELSSAEQSVLLHKRLGDYSRKVYKKTHEQRTVVRTSTICQRENPFYIDTVRDFRDRRYEYKARHKTWKKNLDAAQRKSADGDGSLADVVEAKKMIVLYDSLQLAHKCILNSFYGYVMRKGARWYSMEMAGITCLTGARIIQMAKDLVDRIGRPLELDTDGIWCMLPGVFPENFSFRTRQGKDFGISYPCTMLNHLVHERFTNHQYHTLNSETGRYEVRSENSIFFELDGPYRAMILPSSKEEDKLLKKRYAVFEHDGSLAELKGFEVKRRGELQLIKDFQKQIFEKFLLGSTLEECYAAVAKVADQWLDVLFSKGATLHDEELIDLIAENKSMSRTLTEYGEQKSTAITTAKRLAEFLGAQMVKDKGLACKFVISAKPQGAPVTERAVPVAIFNAEPAVKQHYLRRFLRDNSQTDFDLRSILDWDYYIERFGGVIQKLITIPAAMQRVPNPVPRIRHPDWLFKRVAAHEDKFKQRKLQDLFAKQIQAKPEAKLVQPWADAKRDDLAGRAQASPADDQGDAADEPLPDMNVDYPGWLRVMKKRWRRERKEREQGGAAAAASRAAEARRNAPLGPVHSLFSRRSQSMATAVWNVLQLAPTTRPGEFRLWIAIDGQLHGLRLRVPRQFYISFKSEPSPGTFSEGYAAEKLTRILPRAAPSQHLFRLTVAEETFREREEHFSSLVNSPNVDGVYEMGVPLDVRAVLQLGSQCQLSARSRGKLARALDVGLDLSDLVASQHNASAQRAYADETRAMRPFYLYHAARDGRHVVGLVTPDGQARIHVVDAAGLRQMPNLETMYADRLARMRANGRCQPGQGLFEYADACRAEVKVHTTEARAFRALSRELQSLRAAKQAPVLLTICSSRSQSYYRQQLGTVASDLPMLTMQAARQEDELPSLGWQLYSARRMINTYLRSSSWMRHWLHLAAQFDVPLCNLETDAVTFGADIDFARRLQRQDMVLWWSDTTQPDLGGREQDGYSVQPGDEEGDEQQQAGTLEISKPGCYSTVTLELAVRNLAIDAVLQSGSVNDMEGSGAASMAFDTASHNLDEYARGTVPSTAQLGSTVLTAQLFNTVKAMVKAWYVDKARGQGAYRHVLVGNFWRWASSAESRMFEPALHNYLQGLMRKTMLQLLAELKRLGVQVVYASFTRLLLLTSKPTAGSAQAYARYLTAAVTSRDLFKHIDLHVVHFWELLLWMDCSNFGGVICERPDELKVPRTPPLDMNWNIATFLPPALQDPFAGAVSFFALELYRAKLRTAGREERTPLGPKRQERADDDGDEDGNDRGEISGEDSEGEGGGARVEDADGAAAVADDGLKALTASARDAALDPRYIRRLVSHTMTRRLLELVGALRQQHQRATTATRDSEAAQAWLAPELPGRRPDAAKSLRSSPLLELVKSVVAVVGLARDASAEVSVMRRNLLELLGVREFAAVAEWRNPCEAWRLRGVICRHCNEERDMDLTRDADLMPARRGEAREWRCARCSAPYDRDALEVRLAGVAQSLVDRFALQDLRCNRCGGVRPDNLQPHCACSGSWGLTVTRRDTLRRLEALAHIAGFHAMPIVAVAVESLLACV